MSRMTGTVSRVIRCPIIKEGDETTPADNEGDPVSPDTGINAAAVILFSAAVMTVSFSASRTG